MANVVYRRAERALREMYAAYVTSLLWGDWEWVE